MTEQVFLIDGARTPFGTFGGSLSTVTATELGTIAAVEAMNRSRVSPNDVDTVVMGNVIQSYRGAAYIARHLALDAGIPKHVPALTLNRLCGSGLEAVVTASRQLRLGEGDIALAGGAENMSMSPYVLRGARFGMRMGNSQAVDLLTEVLTDTRGDVPMGVTAENLAARYNISREEQDEFAAESHRRAAKAEESGRFSREIVPVPVKQRNAETLVAKDEHIRPNTTVEQLGKLRPAFVADGVVTAGNSSGINDGAACVILATERAVVKHGLTPKARLVSAVAVGCEPTEMGFGPVPAIRKLLANAQMEARDIDLFEVNEAFAAQYLSVEKELGLRREVTNVNGGAIALGHPVGASGARILYSLMVELEARQERFGVASLCIGGGQGIAALIERV